MDTRSEAGDLVLPGSAGEEGRLGAGGRGAEAAPVGRAGSAGSIRIGEAGLRGRTARGLPESEPGRPYVYTNEDLERFARPGDRQVEDQRAQDERERQEAFEKEALQRLQDQPAAEAYRERLLLEAQGRVLAAEQSLELLRRLALADANPLVRQPRLSEEEAAAREGMPRDERVSRTQEQIQAAEAELGEAKARLEEIQRQLGQPR